MSPLSPGNSGLARRLEVTRSTNPSRLRSTESVAVTLYGVPPTANCIGGAKSGEAPHASPKIPASREKTVRRTRLVPTPERCAEAAERLR